MSRRKITDDGTPRARTLPGPDTQARKTLRYLADGHRPDHADWYEHTGSWRLASHVGNLRNEYGWPIKSIDIPAPTRVCPRRKITRYYLDQEDVPAARDALRLDAAQRPH
jgi:hypothetical protein